MNYKRGFKRITLLISIIIALGVGVFVGFSLAEEIKKDNRIYETEQGIIEFWEIWNEGGWNKKEVVNKLCRGRGSWFKIKGKTVFLNCYDVFGEIGENFNNLSLEEIEEKAKVGSARAIKSANYMKGIYKYTPKHLMILYCSFAGLVGGVGSFIAVWLAYYILFFLLVLPVLHLLKWIVLGFADKNPTKK